MADKCRVIFRSSSARADATGYLRCSIKVTRDGMCTRHANMADRDKVARASVSGDQ